jgi:hypothetical protein
VINAMTNALDRLIDGLDTAIRTLWRRHRARQLEKLYGNLPARPEAPRRGARSQIGQLAKIVGTHCTKQSEIIASHGSAALNLDAAEYAFSMMLEELRGVMSAPPSAWQPARTPQLRPLPVAISGVAARAA